MADKLSYCINCKKMTGTVLVKDPGIGSFFLSYVIGKRRVCRDCAKSKVRSEVEQE